MYSGTATYNICDDKIRASFDERLSREDYEDLTKRGGFSYWHGSKQFVAKWSVWAEDKLHAFGITEIEDYDEADDVEARVERFSGYAENAEQAAESASDYAHRMIEGIPPGQPILVGHHSERRHRGTLKRHDAAMRRALSEGERAAYWRDRIAASISHAKRKERPDVIARRIKNLEADERRYLKELTDARRAELHARAFLDAKYKTNQESTELDADAFEAKFAENWQRHRAHYQRWVDHVQMVLAYQRELYKQSGGTVTDRKPVEKGGAVKCWASPRGGWSYVKKVNKVSVTVERNWQNGGDNFTTTIPFTDLRATMTAAEVAEARLAGRIVEIDTQGFYLADAAAAGEQEGAAA